MARCAARGLTLRFCGSGRSVLGTTSAWMAKRGGGIAPPAKAAKIDNDIWITAEAAEEVRLRFGTPCYVYSAALLEKHARECLAFPAPYGLTVRYAMKAASNARILGLLSDLGVHIDTSSGFEVSRALQAGIPGDRISLSAQRLPMNLDRLLQTGVHVNACSLHQIKQLGDAGFKSIGLRFNPGVGSGGTNKTNVGGPSSSFGIWHELLEEAKSIASSSDITIDRIHTHIGSGSDPDVWARAAGLTLELARRFPTASRVDLGGGFKVRRTNPEVTTDLQKVGLPICSLLEKFAAETGRKLHLEIEPGTFLVARAGVLIASVADVVATSPLEKGGYRFIKLDAGMTEILRPTMYGAQHAIQVFTDRPPVKQVVVGHCCESGDLLTPSPHDGSELMPRMLPQADIGDLVVLGGCGAYCASMAATNYNSFPAAPEVMIGDSGIEMIRSRQLVHAVPALESRNVDFHKFHGCGNDFIVVDHRWTDETPFGLVRAAVALCDRNRGIGADGIFVLLRSSIADYKLRIYNPDGSEPEMCGNGVRCVAAYVRELADGPAQMTFETLAGPIECTVSEAGVVVGMGPPRLEATAVPTTLVGGEETSITVSGRKLSVTPVGMGNPHCVLFGTSADVKQWEAIASDLEVATNEFPQKTNVELCVVESRSKIRCKVWERGAGWTLACGTGACAVAVAGSILGHTDRQCTVALPGGELNIDWREDQVYMTGPAAYVFSGSVPLPV